MSIEEDQASFPTLGKLEEAQPSADRTADQLGQYGLEGGNMDARRRHNVVESPISCRRHGDVFVVGVGSTAAFDLTRDEASEFAEMLETEVTYHVLGVEVLGETGAADAPIMIADVSLTQREAQRLLAALQSVSDQDDKLRRHRVNWQEDGF